MLKGKLPKYKLSLSTKRVYDNSELSMYCSPECLIASKLFTSQLQTIPIHLRSPEDIKKYVCMIYLLYSKIIFYCRHEIKLAGELSEASVTSNEEKASPLALLQGAILPYNNPQETKESMYAQLLFPTPKS